AHTCAWAAASGAGAPARFSARSGAVLRVAAHGAAHPAQAQTEDDRLVVLAPSSPPALSRTAYPPAQLALIDAVAATVCDALRQPARGRAWLRAAVAGALVGG